MTIDAKTFDTLVSYTPELEQALRMSSRRRLTPARMFVLAMLSHAAPRAEIRHAARALGHHSKYRAQIWRVRFRARLCDILRDLRALGLVQAKRRRDGSLRFTLKAHVRRRMEPFIERAAGTLRQAL